MNKELLASSLRNLRSSIHRIIDGLDTKTTYFENLVNDQSPNVFSSEEWAVYAEQIRIKEELRRALD